jgi:hypothetical protein
MSLEEQILSFVSDSPAVSVAVATFSVIGFFGLLLICSSFFNIFSRNFVNFIKSTIKKIKLHSKIKIRALIVTLYKLTASFSNELDQDKVFLVPIEADGSCDNCYCKGFDNCPKSYCKAGTFNFIVVK